jgi:methyltransferase (TIGR00027 family)
MSKRIESGISKTAQWTLIARGVSYSEKNRFYKSDDKLASVFMPGFEQPSKKLQLKLMCKYFSGRGGYEQVIARTKYIDEIFKGMAEDIGQVLIMGAGFDTRAIRFAEKLKNKTVFELDSVHTQKAKTGWLAKIRFKLPENLKFIGMDFDVDLLNEKLDETGFQKNKKCLFLLEGLLPYLQTGTVEKIFDVIEDYSAPKSLVVFDYLYSSALNLENVHKGKNRLVELADKAGEKCHFGIDKGQLDDFLGRYGLKLLDESDSDKLEEKYFTDEKGKKRVHIRGSHGQMVTAEKR